MTLDTHLLEPQAIGLTEECDPEYEQASQDFQHAEEYWGRPSSVDM